MITADELRGIELFSSLGDADLQRFARKAALFMMIGADAMTDWLPEGLERDEKGYRRTGRDLLSW